ncbi:hypothetical protein Tco_0857438 [Tanacetum coccineum]|uniref:Retrotransposon gag domain-containing protein n=1 Tax=Tanacetum coccineum TaxID=301880 RepID=A0ABQ5BA82_9ASTR
MHTRSSSNLIVESFTIPKRRNRRRSKQIIKPELRTIVETPVATMADTRTMSELLQAPTEGYEDAIVIPPILAENFELKVELRSLITSMLKYKNVPHEAIKLMLFPFSLEGAARIWLEKEPPRSILTWKISFLKLHQIDMFYNALTQSDQDSLNAAAGGNLLNRTPRDALTIIENKSKVRTSRNKPIVLKVSTTTSSSSPSSDVTALTEIVKELLLMNKATQQAFVKAIEEICVTCGGPHPYYECLATDGNTFNASAATGTYNQGGPGYRPQGDPNYRAKNKSCTFSKLILMFYRRYARNYPKPRVPDSKYFMEQMLLAKQDEAGVILTNEQNDFLFADASRMEEIEELSANIYLMARIQPADNTSDVGPSYDSAFISEVQSSSNTENEEQMYQTHTKIINSTIGDNNINSDIIFDSPNGNVNSGSIEKDTHVPDLCALEQLAKNAYHEAEKQQIFAQKADKRAKHFSQQAQSQFVRDRDIIRDLEKQQDKLDLDVKDYKRQNEELQKTHSILKRQMSENEDKYHDTVLDLEAKLKKNVDLILKLGNSLQGMFMLGPKPLSVYDQQLKHGLGYPNPYTLKQAISQCPKLYLASSLGNSEISLNVRDTEDTLDDASKSQQKVYEKMNDPIAVANKQNCWTIDYAQINALYKDFVPQKELSAEQKYFPSSFIPSDKNSNATPSIPASMPSESPLIIELDKIKNCFQRDIKEMKDVFESTESELCELEKQNDFLKYQLLEVSLKHEVELSVLLNHESVDNSLHAEIEQLKKKSIEIQEGLQA